MAYTEKVIEHFERPKNVGSFGKEEENVGTGVVGAPECGDVMKLQLKINPDTEVIEDAKFKTFGCGSAIASSSYVTELVKGKTVAEAYEIQNTQIVTELSLPPVKIHCSVLAEDAIKAAVADWREKGRTSSYQLEGSGLGFPPPSTSLARGINGYTIECGQEAAGAH
jgi:nitrogen fixation NifU-like protein